MSSRDEKEQVVSKGLLYQNASSNMFSIERRLPSPDLALFVQHYWIARWDLRGRDPFTSETLPYPGINLVIENDEARVWGVFSSKSDKVLSGQGRGCAILFRPGGFYPFYKKSIAALTDNSAGLPDVFGPRGPELINAVRASVGDNEIIDCFERFLRAEKPVADNHIILVNKIIDTVIHDRETTKVQQVCAQFALSERTLQDLFSNYVGIGLKWVIMRYRLQDATQRITDGDKIDWAELALNLGYADQAHFINDFRKVIGKVPTDYAKIERESQVRKPPT